MSLKPNKNQTQLPSGIILSNDGKYRFWECSVSGLKMFAMADYWEKVMARYGTEENIVKNYVCRKAKKLLDAGKSPEFIRAFLSPPKKVKVKKEKKVKVEKLVVVIQPGQKRRGRPPGSKNRTAEEKIALAAEVKQESDSPTTVKKIVVEEVPVERTHIESFKGMILRPLSIAEATRDCCAFPNIYLDTDCRQCPVHNECVFERKFTQEYWDNPKKKFPLKITPLESFSESEIKSVGE